MYTAEDKIVFDRYRQAAEATVNMPSNWLTLKHSTYADMRVIMAIHLLRAGYKRVDIALYMQLDISNITRSIPKYDFRIKNEKKFQMLNDKFLEKLAHRQNK